MCSHALSDDVTLHTKKAILLLKESNCVWQRNRLKNCSKKESILAPPRIDSSMNQIFPLLIPEHTLRVEDHGNFGHDGGRRSRSVLYSCYTTSPELRVNGYHSSVKKNLSYSYLFPSYPQNKRNKM